MKGLVCVIPGCAGLSSSDARLPGSIGILATSLGFARCFCKPSLHFASQFRNLKAISKLGGDFADISKFGDHFTAISKLRDHFIAISKLKSDFAA